MSWITTVLARRRMVISVVVLLSLAGALAWKNMIRQEDPAFPYRYGFVLVHFPGADVEQVEHLVTRPLEEEISEVEYVEEIEAIIRAGFVQLIVGRPSTTPTRPGTGSGWPWNAPAPASRKAWAPRSWTTA